MTRTYRLSLHTSPVSWVDAGSYPAAGGCHIVCLSDRQCAIIRDMVYPAATWPSRFAVRQYGERFQQGDAEVFSEHLKEISDLLYQVSEASAMACTELVQALTDLAAALAAGATGGGGTTVVNCGGGGSASGVMTMADCLAMYDAGALVPLDDYEEPDPAGDPPDGFDTWEDYWLYKCKAAHWVVDSLINSIRNLGTVTVLAGALNLVTFAVGGALAAFAAVIAPPAFLAIVAVMVQLEVVASAANSLLVQVADYLAERRSELVCAMYNSGSAADAVAVLSSVLDDAIDAIEYGGAFAGLGSAIGPLMTTLATELVDRRIVQSLWSVSADVVYPNADCDPCDPYAGYLAATALDEPYNVLEVGDSVTFGANSAANGYQVISPTPGRLYFTPEAAVDSIKLNSEYYHAQSGWTVVGAQIYRASDDAEMCSFTVPDSNSSWQTINSTKSVTLVADVQYYLRLSPAGGNSTWHRRIRLEAV